MVDFTTRIAYKLLHKYVHKEIVYVISQKYTTACINPLQARVMDAEI